MARVLIVDDDPDILKITDMLLTRGGHDVITASDAIRAMDLLNSSSFDLLISDARMPHFSGFELIQTLKNNKRFEEMAVAMLTSLRERRDIEKAIRAGVNDYIIKPIDPLVFLKKVDELLERFPPKDRAILEFAPSTAYSEGKVTLPLQILNLSEAGVLCHSNIAYAEGSVIEINIPVFEDLGQAKQTMKVIACKEVADNEWEIELGFYAMPDDFTENIREWILNFSKPKAA